MIEASAYTVFLGGAGVSTDSGIPDFRGSGGLYSSKSKGVSPEFMLSHTCLAEYPEQFYEYYRKNMLYPNARPCGAHYALAELERMGRLGAIITQNIDGLHQMAGSKNVIELHGSVHRNYCERCGRVYHFDIGEAGAKMPQCECGEVLRPDVVLYGEGLPSDAFGRAEQACLRADLMIVGGTSLTVYPAAGFAERFSEKGLVIINMTPTPFDEYAELVIREPISDVLCETVKKYRKTIEFSSGP